MLSMINKSFVNYKQNVCFEFAANHVNFLFMGDNSEIKRIELAIKEKGMTMPEFQAALNIKSQHWNNWKNRGVPGKRIVDIAKILGVSADWLLTGTCLKTTAEQSTTPKPESNAIWHGGLSLWDDNTSLDYDEVALPFFKEVELAAGAGSTMIQENHGRKLRFSKSTLRSCGVTPDHAACVTVTGNSMEPVLPDGSTIGIDTSKTTIQDGKIYAIEHDGHLRVKRLYKMPGGKIRLNSYNKDEWPDETVSVDEIRILGKVFWYSVLTN